MTALIDFWWNWMSKMSVQIAFLICILAVVSFFWKKSSAKIFYILWLLVLAKLILPPDISHQYSMSNVVYSISGVKLIKEINAKPGGRDFKLNNRVSETAGLSTNSSAANNSSSDNSASVSKENAGAYSSSSSLSPASSAAKNNKNAEFKFSANKILSSALANFKPALFIVWFAGLLCMILFQFIKMKKFRTWLNVYGEKAPEWFKERVAELSEKAGLENPPQTIIVPEGISPSIFGLFKSKLLFPPDLLSALRKEEVDSAIYHELVHIKRKDTIVNALQYFIQSLYWFHPLVWLTAKEIRNHREMSVDESVINSFPDIKPKVYENTILAIAENRTAISVPAMIGIWEPKSFLLRRVINIMDRRETKNKWGRLILNIAVIILFAVFVIPMGIIDAKAENLDKEKKDKKETVATKPYPEVLNEMQAVYQEWTEKNFAKILDQSEYKDLSDSAKAEMETKWIDILNAGFSDKYYTAINALAEINSQKAGEALLKIAAEKREKDNRDRWMAVRALGIIDYKPAIPELIHLTYHYNRNTRIWAQISLARMTGVNFAYDFEKWGEWWNSRGGNPPFNPAKVEWAESGEAKEWGDMEKSIPKDMDAIIQLRAQLGLPKSPEEAELEKKNSEPNPNSKINILWFRDRNYDVESIYTHNTWGYSGAAALTKEMGAYNVEVKDDFTLTEKYLSGFDVIVFLNVVSGEILMPDEKAAISAFLKQGKGIIVLGQQDKGVELSKEAVFANSVTVPYGIEFAAGNSEDSAEFLEHYITYKVKGIPGGGSVFKLYENAKAVAPSSGTNCILAVSEFEKGKIVAISDDSAFTDQYMNRNNNRQLFVNIMAWLLNGKSERAISLREAYFEDNIKTPPKIVKTIPEIGASNVDPAITEIVVVFDQKMYNSFSWTGSGEYYPEANAKPFWRDAYTCVLPVKLKDAWFYRVGINSTSYQNFRGINEKPAPPSAIYFTTAGAGEEFTKYLAPPAITEMRPAKGENKVDFNLTELRVTFNQEMGSGCSWTGGGENFPEITGSPRWENDNKTCILPVKLKPDWEYRLGINSLSHINFQSKFGLAVEPVEYIFKTAEK